MKRIIEGAGETVIEHSDPYGCKADVEQELNTMPDEEEPMDGLRQLIAELNRTAELLRQVIETLRAEDADQDRIISELVKENGRLRMLTHKPE